MHRKSHAMVVLPAGFAATGDTSVSDANRRWLARSRTICAEPQEPLLQALSALDIELPGEGLGALRLWGQTGIRQSGWVAAADPVWLEARLDHLVLHPLQASELTEAEVREIFAYLQHRLGNHESCSFVNVGKLGYLHHRQPMATAVASPSMARGDAPGDYMPSGPQAELHDRLQSEVQMCLHECPVNERRAQGGQLPVNALWLWGGGVARPARRRDMPALCGDDPLFRGFWYSAEGEIADGAEGLDFSLAGSRRDFVAVVPGSDSGGASRLDAHLSVLRRMLERGKLRAVTFLFNDGVRADLKRWDGMRLWRRRPAAARGPASQ